ncbi:MAG: adenylyltransferase/cytidyltransferase family protein [Planctomycetota bacterium]
MPPRDDRRPLTLPELLASVGARRSAGERAVLTNGCFDLLHVGHLRALEDGATRGDYLIVCINDDASVRSSKGEGRPVFPAAERAELLLGLRAVDLVHVFSGETVDDVLRAVRPEVYAKGRDYTPDSIPEAPTVRAYGGEIVIVGDPKDHSTREILRSIHTKGT